VCGGVVKEADKQKQADNQTTSSRIENTSGKKYEKCTLCARENEWRSEKEVNRTSTFERIRRDLEQIAKENRIHNKITTVDKQIESENEDVIMDHVDEEQVVEQPPLTVRNKLRTSKIRRCDKCENVLMKPELKPSSSVLVRTW